MTPDDLDAADEVCRAAGAEHLLQWLAVDDPALALDALRSRRKELQAQQGNPKLKDLAKLVITRFRRLEAALQRPDAYLDAVRRRRADAHLPLLDMGVDGVLADGTVTEEELAFLEATAERLGLDGDAAVARLRDRARHVGVSLAPPPRVEGPEHPLLPAGWLNDPVSRWLDAELPPLHRLVLPASAHPGLPCVLAARRRQLSTLVFGRPHEVAGAERAFDLAGVSSAVALPGVPTSLPLDDGSVDGVGFVFHRPAPAELEEARRVLSVGGTLLWLEVAPPTVWWRGPLPAADAALAALFEVAPPPGPPPEAASVHVVTTAFAGPAAALASDLGRRVEAHARAWGLPNGHPALKRARFVVQELAHAPGGHGWIGVPLVLSLFRR